MKTDKKMPKPTIGRITCYLRFLRNIVPNQVFVSSNDIAQYMGLKPIVVKKDLSCVCSVEGKPKVGYSRKQLIQDITKTLGYDTPINAIIVGVGKLGITLLSYDGFADYGLNIMAGFDASTKIKKIENKPIYHMKELDNFIKKHKIKIGIITVPKDVAQVVCDSLLRAGVNSI
jgi:redox-sensing transcriptional repressor